MRLLILSALALPAASSALPPPVPVQPAPLAQRDCPADASLRLAKRPRVNRGATTLGEEPAGDLAYAVWNHVGGCHKPLLIREGIGFGPGQPPSDQPALP
jgi:hypothetical protein